MADRTVTRSIECDAPPKSLLETLRHPENIPRWAREFADKLEKRGGSMYTATKEGKLFNLRAFVELSSCSVGSLREIGPGEEGGAFIRILPCPGGGSVVVPVPLSATRDRVNEILGGELTNLVQLVAAVDDRNVSDKA